MKKFSNQDIERKTTTKLTKAINRLIKEKVHISYNGDIDTLVGKKLTIEGLDTLEEKMRVLIQNYKKEEETILLERLKYRYGSYIDQNEINQQLEYLKEWQGSNVEADLLRPEDIFSAEDYDKITDDTILIKSLNNFPLDYMDYLNRNSVDKYFENGNTVKIMHIHANDGWSINFEPEFSKYGTDIDSDSAKYSNFLKENKEFISDFIDATVSLIGAQNLKLNQKLIQSVK